jgi:hypothetical protein
MTRCVNDVPRCSKEWIGVFFSVNLVKCFKQAISAGKPFVRLMRVNEMKWSCPSIHAWDLRGYDELIGIFISGMVSRISCSSVSYERQSRGGEIGRPMIVEIGIRHISSTTYIDDDFISFIQSNSLLAFLSPGIKMTQKIPTSEL